MRNRLAAGAALWILLPPGQAGAQTVALKDAVPHITVRGHASADVVPDEASIALGVEAERPTAAEASAEVARAAAAVVRALKAQGIEDKDVQTVSVELTTVYDEADHPGGVGRTPRGYRAEEALDVRLRDIGKAGALAQHLIQTGANQIKGITFAYSRARETRRELQAAATRDALAEARNEANALGLTLGRVIEIGDSNDPARFGAAEMPMRRVLSMAKTEAAIPLQPGIQTITAEVGVTWELVGP